VHFRLGFFPEFLYRGSPSLLLPLAFLHSVLTVSSSPSSYLCIPQKTILLSQVTLCELPPQRRMI
jgi:hypothetical protein